MTAQVNEAAQLLEQLAQARPEAFADVLAHLRGSSEGPETYLAPAQGWTCFHCGETFLTAGGARLHFGPTPDRRPTCFPEI